MKRAVFILLLMLFFLAFLPAKDYSYVVYWEDGIYTFSIENKKFILSDCFKYKIKQRPWYRYFSSDDSVVMYDSMYKDYYCMFYRLNRQTQNFEEMYKIDRYNPYKECIVSVKDFIYMIERNLTKDTDSYSLTKRSFGSPDVIEKVDLEIPYKGIVYDAFFFNDYLVIPRDNKYCILSKKTGKCLYSGKGKILFNRNSQSIFILENERNLYSVNLDESGFSKKLIKTFITGKQIILDIIDYDDFCILTAGEWKTNYNLVSRFIFDHKRKLVSTTYYCTKKDGELVKERKMNNIKLN